jgi:hypothetical protein
MIIFTRVMYYDIGVWLFSCTVFAEPSDSTQTFFYKSIYVGCNEHSKWNFFQGKIVTCYVHIIYLSRPLYLGPAGNTVFIWISHTQLIKYVNHFEENRNLQKNIFTFNVSLLMYTVLHLTANITFVISVFLWRPIKYDAPKEYITTLSTFTVFWKDRKERDIT